METADHLPVSVQLQKVTDKFKEVFEVFKAAQMFKRPDAL